MATNQPGVLSLTLSDLSILQNCSLGIVGKDLPFTIYDDERVKPYLDAIEGDTRGPGAGRDDPPGGPDDDDENRPRPTSGAQVNVAMESMEH